jgi:protein involved in polysaccharide export with SLBB domain
MQACATQRMAIGWTGAAAALALLALSGCMGDPVPRSAPAFRPEPFPTWTARDAGYRYYPGDQLRIDVRTAPELSADLTIGPDGRITLPTFGPVMVAGLSNDGVQKLVQDVYGRELIDPSLTVTTLELGSQQIFVGGEVENPGVFVLPGEINPFQAIVLAGGVTDDGRKTQVVVMRRDPQAGVLTRVINLRSELAKATFDEIGPLQRFDVVYVTRKAISDENLFVRQFIRDALPVDFGLYYDITRF